MKLILILSVLLSVPTHSAQILTPAQWCYKVSKETIHQGDVVELIFSIKLDENWHLFSHVQIQTIK